jgi:chromosome segregation ATPase
MTQTLDQLEQEIAQLRRRRDELRTRLASIEADYRAGLSADSEEQAIQLENAEVLAGIAKATADELARVEARLAELG